jgi:hypothetical protein
MLNHSFLINKIYIFDILVDLIFNLVWLDIRFILILDWTIQINRGKLKT